MAFSKVDMLLFVLFLIALYLLFFRQVAKKDETKAEPVITGHSVSVGSDL